MKVGTVLASLIEAASAAARHARPFGLREHQVD